MLSVLEVLQHSLVLAQREVTFFPVGIDVVTLGVVLCFEPGSCAVPSPASGLLMAWSPPGAALSLFLVLTGSFEQTLVPGFPSRPV